MIKIKLLTLILILTCATAYAEEVDFLKLISLNSKQSESVDKKKAILELFTENEQLELLAIDEYISRYSAITKSIGFLDSDSVIEFIDLAIHYEFFHSNFKDGVFKCKIPSRDSYGKTEKEIIIKEKTLRGVVMYLKARISTKYVGWPVDEMDDVIFKIEATYKFYKEIFNKEKKRIEARTITPAEILL